MSYQFTIDGQLDCWLLNNDNWGRVFRALNKFRYYKRWNLDSQEWLCLYECIRGDFLSNDMVKHKVQPSGKFLTDWLLNCFDFDDLKLTEIDKRNLVIKEFKEV